MFQPGLCDLGRLQARSSRTVHRTCSSKTTEARGRLALTESVGASLEGTHGMVEPGWNRISCRTGQGTAQFDLVAGPIGLQRQQPTSFLRGPTTLARINKGGPCRLGAPTADAPGDRQVPPANLNGNFQVPPQGSLPPPPPRRSGRPTPPSKTITNTTWHALAASFKPDAPP
jgi:hypothetical protein